MVELEHHRVALPAVHARVLAQESDEVFVPLQNQNALAHGGLFDVTLPIRREMLLLAGSAKE